MQRNSYYCNQPKIGAIFFPMKTNVTTSKPTPLLPTHLSFSLWHKLVICPLGSLNCPYFKQVWSFIYQPPGITATHFVFTHSKTAKHSGLPPEPPSQSNHRPQNATSLPLTLPVRVLLPLPESATTLQFPKPTFSVIPCYNFDQCKSQLRWKIIYKWISSRSWRFPPCML